MSRDLYNPRETYLGDGVITAFESKIVVTNKEHLILICTDEDGEEVFNVRGNDAEFVDSLTLRADGFDVEFLDAPADGAKLTFLQADDGPTQPFSFKNLGGFTLAAVERAFDWVVGWGQRHQFLIDRSLKLHDADDNSEFDMALPIGTDQEASALKLIQVNEDYDGFQLSSPEDVLAGVAGNSDDEFLLEDAAANELIPDMIVTALQTSAMFLVEIQGAGIAGHMFVSVSKLDGDWNVSTGPFQGAGDPGIDSFDVEDLTAEDAQVVVNDDGAGAGDRTIRWKKWGFDA
jgi:hypothetical protein